MSKIFCFILGYVIGHLLFRFYKFILNYYDKNIKVSTYRVVYEIHANGNQAWYQNGYIHREDGPAIIGANGAQEWLKNGEFHREDGPAIIWSDGGQEWWENGYIIAYKK